MKLKNKGQALVEFVLIIPILIMILCIIIDFSFVFYNKNHLEGILNDTVSYVSNNIDETEIEKIINDESIDISINYNNKTATIKLTKEVNLITPFSNTFFDNPYKISTERVIYYEK